MLMEVKPAPLGVTPPSSSSSGTTTGKADVCFSGTLSGWSELAQGFTYYTDTMGHVIKGDSYYGRDSSTQWGYMYDSASETYVTVDGKIGFAPTTNSMFVHVQA